jgi:hypothetical protein
MYDAAFPPAAPPVTTAFLAYLGGDTPHVWTPAEIAAQKARYRLACWVRSNPTPQQASGDGTAFCGALKALGWPTGTATVLDLETAVTPAYVLTFGTVLHSEGWLVLPYGSSSTLRLNPALDGYFVAIPGATSIPSWAVACQYAEDVDNGAYDLSWVGDQVPLWDTQGNVGPPAAAKGDEMIAATTTGNGYVVARPTGAVFAYGDANYHGGANTGTQLTAGETIVGIALRPQNDGYWLTSTTGAVFAYGAAAYLGGPNK